jgi:hypothetical protein
MPEYSVLSTKFRDFYFFTGYFFLQMGPLGKQSDSQTSLPTWKVAVNSRFCFTPQNCPPIHFFLPFTTDFLCFACCVSKQLLRQKAMVSFYTILRFLLCGRWVWFGVWFVSLWSPQLPTLGAPAVNVAQWHKYLCGGIWSLGLSLTVHSILTCNLQKGSS